MTMLKPPPSQLFTLPIRLQTHRLDRFQPSIHRPHFLHPPLKTFPHPLKSSHLTYRLASTTTTAAARTAAQTTTTASLLTRTKNLFLGTSIALSLVFAYLYITDVRAGIHQWAVVPSLRWFYEDAEEAHERGTELLGGLWAWGVYPRERGAKEGERLEVEVFGHMLANPIGTSAGIDKHAAIPSPLFHLGPSIVEIGGCTPYPQDGNARPRVFRLPSQNALINRYGLNSEGADHVAMKLRQRVREYAYGMGFGIDEEAEQRVLDGEAGVPGGSLMPGRLLAVQVAKNSWTPDDDIEAVKADYVYCVDAVARYSDIIVVNVSSPNTPGLRGLQRVEPLTNILKGVVSAAKRATKTTRPAVMVKVSPDEDSEEQVRGICDAVWESGVDGVIVGNTTKRRPEPLGALPSREAAVLLEQGGYSGPQLFERTVELTKRYRTLLDEGMQAKPGPSPMPSKAPSQAIQIQASPDEDLSARIEATTARDEKNLKPDTPEAEAESKSQPLFMLPERNIPSSSGDSGSSDTPALSASHHVDQLPAAPSQQDSGKGNSKRKVIFATGGITNGKQALEVLEAGASVAQVYTALVYGGVGTIARIKDEMRDEMETSRRKSQP
ncbi:hypothetical protein N7G274_006924 [Stereocaulon virgatum]|uniref:Dihydroorotate dehydrogenase catalytic domain-containing protein n=1 Tax=Stereocaulon virgatum TaxID=373712 RepID=A0ABR4A548_9LECA